MLEDVAAISGDGSKQAIQILAWIEESLTLEPRASDIERRNLTHEGGREAQIFGELRLLFELGGREAISSQRFVQEAGDSPKVAVDRLGLDVAFDTVDGNLAGVPNGRGRVATKILDQVGEEHVRDHGQMRCRVAGVAGRTRRALEKRHVDARSLQKIGSRDTGDAAANDGHVDSEVSIEGRKRSSWCCVEPIR